MATIRNPIEWSWDQFRLAASAVESAGKAMARMQEGTDTPLPAVRRIAVADLRGVLAQGFADFAAYRTDVIFLCVIYPVVGLILARLAFGYEMLPLLFPLASGFALVGPFAAVGLYEVSRRREQGIHSAWQDAFDVVRSPAFGAIALLGTVLVGIFLMWLATAQAIYNATLGPKPPLSLTDFARDVVTTDAGWALIGFGVGAGFLFALLVLMISVVSFPMLLDRDVGLGTAVRTSVRAALLNPGPLAAWGLIVAAALVIGSIPLLIGLAIVMPVLGHATWHLYRKLVSP
jgi:uncharacterized membrane protein